MTWRIYHFNWDSLEKCSGTSERGSERGSVMTLAESRKSQGGPLEIPSLPPLVVLKRGTSTAVRDSSGMDEELALSAQLARSFSGDA